MKPSAQRTYTCADYRAEMRLLGLRRRLEEEGVGREERARLLREIEELERALGLC